jgi:hypothetical protein
MALIITLAVLLLASTTTQYLRAQVEEPTSPVAAPAGPMQEGEQANPNLVRLSPDHEVWIDRVKKEIHIGGSVCLQEGQLEMLVTLTGGKTHESVVEVKTNAYIVHAALLALGAESGSPTQFAPVFKPATGTEVAVYFEWVDSDGKTQRVPGQDWVRWISTQQALKDPFVFAGSVLRREPNGRIRYEAEQGDFICVSNFPTAMLDLPTKSSAEASDLMFEAFKERIPPLGTPVKVILAPKLAKKE